MSDKTYFIILFDGFCNLCNGTVQFIIKRDSNYKFKFASLQSQIGQSLLKKHNLPINEIDTFVLIKENKYFIKSKAGLLVLKELNWFWKISYFFIIIPKPIRDFFYDIIAKKRYKVFGRKANCMLPTASISNRFI